MSTLYDTFFSVDRFRLLIIITLFLNGLYLIWLVDKVQSWFGIVFFALEALIFLLIIIFAINHWERKYVMAGGSYSMRAIVDIFITTKNEPVEMLEKTIAGAVRILYSEKRIYLLDDGGRDEIKKLAKKHGVSYMRRPHSDLNPYKAANLNYALEQTYGTFILTLDADTIPDENILEDLLGHFNTENVALVASRQRFEINDADFNNDNVFYEYMQTGKNTIGVGISCGAGAIYRRTALQDIGGFAEWNLVEDLTTTYMLNERGWRSVYVNQSYTLGDAPRDLKIIYKQRGTWALDTLRLFFRKFPLLNKNLALRARLHYFEMGYIYIVSALIIPGVYFLNFASLFTNTQILYDVNYWYLTIKFPAFFSTIVLYDRLGQGSSSSRMWAALYPVYLKALILSLFPYKQHYRVTKKGATQQRRLSLVIPQAVTVLIGFCAVWYHAIYFGFSPLFTINIFWFMIIIYWLSAVFPKALVLQHE